ncbi:unnamed protein product [Paramecium sonneborni]|uniref:Uncharacterized protein n=1 Tax=Paramecium sonneborni TaxID=65129 RepID=A0A8S1NXQ8_9CILI|nr:unnamed protein product [Paramecium sonneborni]
MEIPSISHIHLNSKKLSQKNESQQIRSSNTKRIQITFRNNIIWMKNSQNLYC